LRPCSATNKIGLDDGCINDVLDVTLKINYEKPKKKEVKAASTREKIEGGMSPEMAVTYQNLRVTPAVIPFRPTPEVTTPEQKGDDIQNPLQEGQKPGDLIGNYTPGSNEENNQDTSF
jgi:hypothetical protein